LARASKGDGLGRSSFEGRDAAKLAQAARACLRARPTQDDGIWIELTGTLWLGGA